MERTKPSASAGETTTPPTRAALPRNDHLFKKFGHCADAKRCMSEDDVTAV